MKPFVIFALIAFGVFRFYNTAMIHKSSPPFPSAINKKSYEYLKQVTTRDSVIVSDISYQISTFVGCRSIRLPVFPADIIKINDNYLPIDYILISNNISPSYIYSDYGTYIRSNVFLKRFKLMKILPDASALFTRIRE